MKTRISLIVCVISILLLASIMCVNVNDTQSPPEMTAFILNSTYVKDATLRHTTPSPTILYVTSNPDLTSSILIVTERGIVEVTP